MPDIPGRVVLAEYTLVAPESIQHVTGKPDSSFAPKFLTLASGVTGPGLMPVDGATIARAWISQGGPAKFLLNDGMNSPDFITSVGAKYLNDAYGTSSGTNPTASTEYFNANYKAFSGGIDPSNPAADRAYDAGAIVGLAIAAAPSQDPIAIRDAMFKVTSADGEAIHAGKADFAKALDLLKAGKPIRYEGVIGPVSFDQYGDITGPFRLWKITDGTVTTVGQISTDDVNAIKAKIAK